MEKINYFPSCLLSEHSSGNISRQDYFFKLLRDKKQFEDFENSYLSFCNIQENETCVESSNCLLFNGFCSNIFTKKTKIIKKDWKKIFLSECLKIKSKCFWVNFIINVFKKSEKKKNISFQNEILAINFIYFNESDVDFFDFSEKFRKIFFHSKILLSKEGSNLNLLINSDYLDSEIYSHSKPKEYEYFSCKFPPPPNKSFSKYDASSSSYQNNTIIENTKNCFSEEMNLNEYEKTLSLQKKSLTHYKLLTDIIEDHLDKKEHPLNILKEKFIEQFVNYFEEIQPNPIFSNRNEKFTLMILNLLEFIRIFQHSVILFYGLISSKIFLKSMCYFTQENFLQFITSLFLNDPKIYNLLFQLSYEVNHDIEEKIERNYKNFTNLHPEAFGISKELCLNNKTIKFFKGEEDTSTNTFKLKEPTEQNFDHIFKGKITWDADDEYGNEIEYSSLKSPLILKDFMGFKNSCTIEEKNKILNQVSSNEDFCKNIRKSLAVRTMVLSEHKQTRKSIKIFDKKKSDIFRFSFENAPPYELAILNLKKISKLRSPIHKLKNILKTAVLIIDCIKQFYSKFQKDFSNEKEINSDEIMSILIYICCKGEIKGLFSQCALIESFLTNQISTSVAGYYLITLKASLEYISSEEILMKNQEKNN